MQFMDTKDAETAKTAASAHLGLAWVPWFTARHALARGQLEEFGSRLDFPNSWIHLIHRRPVVNPALGSMIHFLHEVRRLPAIRQFVFPEDFAVSLHGVPSLASAGSA
jgi:DNA-binding transcriptional LysR family regulator